MNPSSAAKVVRFIWRKAWQHPGTVVVLIIAVFFSVMPSIVAPLYLKQFFNLLETSTPSRAIVPQLIGILLVIIAIRGIAWLAYRVQNFVNIKFEAVVMKDIMDSCFEYLHGHSYRFFANRFVGALVRRATRLSDAFEAIVDKCLLDFLPIIIRMTAILIILFLNNTFIATLILSWSVIYIIGNYFFARYKRRFDIKVGELDSEVSGFLADTITNSTALKSYAAEREEHEDFQRVTARHGAARLTSWRLSAYLDTVQSALMIGLEFAVLYFAVRYWSAGSLTLGDFVLIQVYLLTMFDFLWNFGRVLRQFFKHTTDAFEMVEILETPHEVTDVEAATDLVIRHAEIIFERVTFTYNGISDILRDIDLVICPGEKVGLVGTSGAGKSTLVNLLLRFFDLTKGRILIDGQDIARVTQRSLRKNIALVPQDPVLFHRTLEENIRFGTPEASDDQVYAASRLARCDVFINDLPEKYKTYVGERGIKLSGGERQRIAIARAVLKASPILVLDEATSSLDSHSEMLIKEAMDGLMMGKTVIVVAHRLSTLVKMDKIIVLDRGVIREIGPHESLIANQNSLYKKLWNLQVGGFIS